jgi:hypothetical protein
MPIAIDSTALRPNPDDPDSKAEYVRDRITASFFVNGWPTFYLIDHNGVVRTSSHSAVEKEIEKLLNELSKSGASGPAPSQPPGSE